MALTPSVRSSQAGAIVTTVNTTNIRVSLGAALVVANFPTPELYASQAGVVVTGHHVSTDMRVSQAGVMVVARGRIGNPRVRAYTFSLDDHDFYDIRLGEGETLRYDMRTDQWAVVGMGDDENWWFSPAGNWLGAGNFAANYGSNIVCGDDTYGLLWFLDPRQPYDDHPLIDEPVRFTRRAVGQIVARGSLATPCYEVFLTGSLGEPAQPGLGVTLSTSDDAGHTYFDHGEITINEGEYTQRVSWIGLGQITAPGRLFKVEDDGAITRLDALDMTVSPDE